MISNAYSIFDIKARTWSVPFYQPTDSAAQRVMQEVVDDRNTSISRHPADFRLYRVGTFDTDTALLSAFDPPNLVCDIVSLLPPPNLDFFKPDLTRAAEDTVQPTNPVK